MSYQHSSQHWFVPLAQLRQSGGAELIPWDDPVNAQSDLSSGQEQGHETYVEPGSPFTLSLESFCINETLDRRSGNDLLVRSWTMYGNAPPVEMVHCFERNAKVGQVIDNLAIEHMFALEAFDPSLSLSVYVQILEVDGHHSLEDDLLNVAQSLGGVFPTLLPFTTVSIPLYKRLRSMFAKHDRTVDAFTGTVQWSGVQDDGAASPMGLRAGAYVICLEPIVGTTYRLQGLTLIPTQENSPASPSYVVIKVVPQLVQSYNPEDLRVNQNLAAALLNPTHGSELKAPEFIHTLNQNVQAFSHLQAAAQKAMLLDDLVEYRTLRQLQKTEPHNESQRDRLLRMERLQILKARLAQDALLPALQNPKSKIP